MQITWRSSDSETGELRDAVRREEKDKMGRDSGGRTLGLGCEWVEGGL